MVHGMLGYAEVYTDIKSIQVSTLPLELRVGVNYDKNNNFDELFVNDAAEIGIMINNERREFCIRRMLIQIMKLKF